MNRYIAASPYAALLSIVAQAAIGCGDDKPVQPEAPKTPPSNGTPSDSSTTESGATSGAPRNDPTSNAPRNDPTQCRFSISTPTEPALVAADGKMVSKLDFECESGLRFYLQDKGSTEAFVNVFTGGDGSSAVSFAYDGKPRTGSFDQTTSVDFDVIIENGELKWRCDRGDAFTATLSEATLDPSTTSALGTDGTAHGTLHTTCAAYKGSFVLSEDQSVGRASIDIRF